MLIDQNVYFFPALPRSDQIQIHNSADVFMKYEFSFKSEYFLLKRYGDLVMDIDLQTSKFIKDPRIEIFDLIKNNTSVELLHKDFAIHCYYVLNILNPYISLSWFKDAYKGRSSVFYKKHFDFLIEFALQINTPYIFFTEDNGFFDLCFTYNNNNRLLSLQYKDIEDVGLEKIWVKKDSDISFINNHSEKFEKTNAFDEIFNEYIYNKKI